MLIMLSLSVYSCQGQKDGPEDEDPGNLAGSSGDATGGKTGAAGGASSHTEGSGGDGMGGEPMGEGGDGGAGAECAGSWLENIGPWSEEASAFPEWPDQLPEVSADEIDGMDCQIEVDRNGDGQADGRWGYDYNGCKLVRSIEDNGESVLVTTFDEQGRPLLACGTTSCDAFSYLRVSIDVGKANRVHIRRADWYESEITPSWWGYTLDGKLSWVSYQVGNGQGGDVESWRVRYDNGIRQSSTRYTLDDSWHLEHYKNGALKSYLHTYEPDDSDDTDDGFIGFSCNKLGWYDTDTTYEIVEGKIVSAQTSAWDDILTSTFVYSSTGDQVTVTTTPSDNAWESTKTYSLAAHLGDADPILTAMEDPLLRQSRKFKFDKRGNVVTALIDLNRDGVVDEEHSYRYSEGCKAGANPQIQLLPHGKTPQLPEQPISCAYEIISDEIRAFYD